MNTSVVMTTYNGEKYIIEQLDSIKNQSRKADEVLIFDDCSTDNTVKKINEYIEKNDLKSWKLHINKSNLGWKKNFIQGIKNANNDLIFLSDQDDVWKNDKIEVMTDLLIDNNDINILCSNYEVLNETDKKIKTNSHLNSLNDGRLVKVEIDEKFHLVGRPGCTYCIRNSFAQKTVTLWNEDYAHDKLFWMASIMTQTLYRVNKSLMFYRRHGNNASGKGHEYNRSIRAHYQELDLLIFKRICDLFLTEMKLVYKDLERKSIFDNYMLWSQRRISNLYKSNLSDSLFCIKCRKYYSSSLSLIADLF